CGHDEPEHRQLLSGVELEQQPREDEWYRGHEQGDRQYRRGEPATPPEPTPVPDDARQSRDADQRQEEAVREADSDHERGGEQELLADEAGRPGEHGERQREEGEREYLRVERFPHERGHDAGSQPEGHGRADEYRPPAGEPRSGRPSRGPADGEDEEAVPG